MLTHHTLYQLSTTEQQRYIRVCRKCRKFIVHAIYFFEIRILKLAISCQRICFFFFFFFFLLFFFRFIRIEIWCSPTLENFSVTLTHVPRQSSIARNMILVPKHKRIHVKVVYYDWIFAFFFFLCLFLWNGAINGTNQ